MSPACAGPSSASDAARHPPSHEPTRPVLGEHPATPLSLPFDGQAPSALTPGRRSARGFPRGSSVEPLAAARYRVQLTADAELKAKLDLARDLMRHSIPSGDLAAILREALDRLIADVMKQRFGARRKKSAPAASPTPARTERAGAESPPRREPASTAHIPRAVCRAVVERDGLRCSWVDARGRRCEERAWLEYDHHQPRAKGGASTVDNVRLLCRSHNRYAAELELGREHVERAIVEARRRGIASGRHRRRPGRASDDEGQRGDASGGAVPSGKGADDSKSVREVLGESCR